MGNSNCCVRSIQINFVETIRLSSILPYKLTTIHCQSLNSDIMAILSGGQKFTKLDVSATYKQNIFDDSLA